MSEANEESDSRKAVVLTLSPSTSLRVNSVEGLRVNSVKGKDLEILRHFVPQDDASLENSVHVRDMRDF